MALLCIPKIIVAYDKDDQVLGAYFGSHNFSQAAWGKITRGQNKIFMNNFELGIFCEADQLILTLPYLSPAPKYKSDDVPWFNPK